VFALLRYIEENTIIEAFVRFRFAFVSLALPLLDIFPETSIVFTKSAEYSFINLYVFTVGKVTKKERKNVLEKIADRGYAKPPYF
jgi:hypothetical protein